MTEANKKENIRLELAKADGALDAAKLLREAGSFDHAVSRAYYAMFHFAQALILMEGLEGKTHGGLAHLINFHFVRSGRLDPDVAKSLSQLAALRQDADYDAAALFTDHTAADAMQMAEQYGRAIRSILSEAGYLTP